MPRYNYLIYDADMDGDCRIILSLYKEGTIGANVQGRLRTQSSVETKLEIRDIKTILGEEFGGRGIWRDNALAFDMPIDFNVGQVLTTQYFDNYVFVPETWP